MTAIMGLDLSLSATGLATWYSADHDRTPRVATIRTPADWPDEGRWEKIAGTVWRTIAENGPDPFRTLIVVEGRINIRGRAELVGGKARITGARGDTTLDLAELRGVIRYGLWRRGVPVAVVHPATLKRFATGNGAANKETMVLAAERRLGAVCPISNNNEADALWLLSMALHHHGRPLCPMPAKNVEALASVTWPNWRIEEKA